MLRLFVMVPDMAKIIRQSFTLVNLKRLNFKQRPGLKTFFAAACRVPHCAAGTADKPFLL